MKTKNILSASILAAIAFSGLAHAQMVSADGKPIKSASQETWSSASGQRATLGAEKVQLQAPVAAPAGQDASVQTTPAEQRAIEAVDLPKSSKASASDMIFVSNLNFQNGKVTLTQESKNRLNEMAYNMSGTRIQRIVVNGHSDNVGSASKNKTLSAQRAESVKAHLVGLGISAERIEVVAHGDVHPVSSNKTAQGRNDNRRVDVKVHTKDAKH